jgi:hypothetical protein
MIRDFVASITKVNEYHRLKNKSIWKVFLYLFVISLMFGLIFSSSIVNRYSKILLIIPENYDTNIPEFKIENSQLKLLSEQKALIEKDKGVLILDTTDSYNESSLEKYDYGALFLKDRFIVKLSKGKVTTKYWTDIDFEGYDKAKVREMIASIPSLIMIFSVACILGLFFICIINSLLISLALLVAKRLWKSEVTFVQLFKMSIHSMTLPIVLIAVLSTVLGDRIAITKYYFIFYSAGVYLLIALRRGEVKPKIQPELRTQIKPKVKSKNKK